MIKLKQHILSLASLLLAGCYMQAVQAYPLTYDIGQGSAPGFSGSWLHAGTTEMGNSGFFANGEKISIMGSLTIDQAAGTATGAMSGTGNFGLGSSDWMLWIDGMTSNTVTFAGGETELLALDYVLESSAGYLDEGVFYFARRDFNGGALDDGPNYIDDNRLYLWGNNWLNANGSADRADFLGQGGTPLGLDLYGEVPEPPVGLLLLVGLLGTGLLGRLRS
jgi:hypothetical protein